MPALAVVYARPASERLEELAERFASYQHTYEATQDGRAVCAFAFQVFYQHLASGFRNNTFGLEDLTWTAQLSEVMAGLFFEAMNSLDAALATSPESPVFDKVPKPWVDAYTIMQNGGTCVLEDLVFGLVAHISYDLPHALAQVGLASNGRSHLHDFHHINGILADSIRTVQQALAERYCPYLSLLFRLTSPFDKLFTAQSFLAARAIAWYNATRLLDPASTIETQQTLEQLAARCIATMRHPRPWYLRLASRGVRLLITGPRRWPTPGNEWLVGNRTRSLSPA